MISTPVISEGNPGSFDLTDKTIPEYYVARLAHELSLNLYNLSLGSWQLQQYQNFDYSEMETAFDGWADNIESWMAAADQASDDGESIAELPAIPNLTTFMPQLLMNPVLCVIAKIAVQLMIHWIKIKMNPDTTGTEIAQMLKKCFLGEENQQLIQMLGNTPLEIILSRGGELQDFLYSDRPEQ